MPIDRRTFMTRTGSALLAIPALAPLRAAAKDDGDANGLKSLQLVVPTPPGTQPDLLARWLLEPITRRAGLPGVVLNRPGAAGAIAADAVLSAPPGVGALLLGGLDHVAYSHLNSNRRALDPFVDFTPVGVVNRDTWLVVTGADGPLRDLAALAAVSRERGGLTYASNGEGSTSHLLAARLCRALGAEGKHVAYSGPYQPDLVAGRVDFALAPTPAMLGAVRGGRVRALAALTPERLPMLDAVPTAGELGVPDLVFQGGLFLFAPAALRAHAASLNGWLVQAQQQPDVAARYREAAIEPTPLSLEQTHAAVAERLRTVEALRAEVFGRGRAGA